MVHKGNEAQGKTNRRVAMFNGKRLSGWMALAVFATVGGAMVATDPAFAKTDVDKLTISGEIRERYEVRNNDSFNRGSAYQQVGAGNNASSAAVNHQKGNSSLASSRVRVGVAYDLTPDVNFFVQMQDARIFGSEGQIGTTATTNSTGAQAVSQTNSNSTGVDLHQGYIQLKNVLVPGLSLKAGRQEIIFGDHRLFGNFGWSQTGNSFDGVRFTQTTEKVDVDLFWARIIDVAGTGFQGANNNNIPFALATGCVSGPGTTCTQSTGNQDIYGAYVTIKPVKNWTIEPYWFLLQDARSNFANNATGIGTAAVNTISTAQAAAQTRNFLGGRVNGKAGSGVVMDFTYEGNYQFGSIADSCSRGSGGAGSATNVGNNIGCGTFAGQAGTVGQVTGSRGAHIAASQHAVRTGFTFDSVPMKPRIGFEFDYASGDKCANGPASGDRNACGGSKTTYNGADNLYPTNHFHMGYMDLMAWRNMVNYQIKFDVKPSPVSKLQFDVNIMRLANTADNWYRAGQAAYFTSKTTNQEASLGTELDIHYWHTFKEKFKFEIGVGRFFAGSYLTKSASSDVAGFAGTQGSSSNGLGNASQIQDQNWGYVMGSIVF